MLTSVFKVKRSLQIIVILSFFQCTFCEGQTSVWEIGVKNDSSGEFSNYSTLNGGIVDTGSILPGAFPKGLKKDVNPFIEIRYPLTTIPQFGVTLSFKLLDANRIGPELAVFSNGPMAGLIQLWGTSEINFPVKWKKTYQLYIPKELLVQGVNTLRLEASLPSYYASSNNPRVWFEWDYLQLSANKELPSEPLHGKLTWLASSHSRMNSGFGLNAEFVKSIKPIFTWLGVAYSGNTTRAEFWSDVTGIQPARLEALNAYKDINMTVIADYLNTGTAAFFNNDGTLSNNGKDSLRNYFNQYSSFFHFYEVDNEPGLFNRRKLHNIDIAKFTSSIRPAHVKIAAPGWAYWPTQGDPAGWERDPKARAEVEVHCQALGGHSYGASYADLNGGSFVENMKTLGSINDGWPKEFIVTETGTNDWHAENNAFNLTSTMPNASAFDRILRAHIAVADRINTHSVVFDDYGIFAPPSNYGDINQYIPRQISGQETRLKTFRRLALAYATHGEPLAYELLNKNELVNKKVYFRAVNTSKLEPLPGNGNKSDKLLLNFVNFEGSPQRLAVRVKLPFIGKYATEKIDDNSRFSSARSVFELQGKPELELDVSLETRGSVQYILTIPKDGVVSQESTPTPVATTITSPPSSPTPTITALPTLAPTEGGGIITTPTPTKFPQLSPDIQRLLLQLLRLILEQLALIPQNTATGKSNVRYFKTRTMKNIQRYVVNFERTLANEERSGRLKDKKAKVLVRKYLQEIKTLRKSSNRDMLKKKLNSMLTYYSKSKALIR
jgi:hypothetical protein